MHGLTGGSWKRSADQATAAEKNHPSGKPRGTHGFATYRRSTPPRQLPTLHQDSPFADRQKTRWCRSHARASGGPSAAGARACAEEPR